MRHCQKTMFLQISMLLWQMNCILVMLTIDGESSGSHIDQVVVAEFQADSCMMGLLLNNAPIMAMTKDTDIPILTSMIFHQ